MQTTTKQNENLDVLIFKGNYVGGFIKQNSHLDVKNYKLSESKYLLDWFQLDSNDKRYQLASVEI